MSDGAERLQRTRERELNRVAVPPLAREFEIHVVGVSFVPSWPGNLYELETLQFMAEDRGEPIPVVLIREPDNPFDTNAIAIHVPSLGEEMGMVGHVPAALAKRLAPHLDAGEQWLGEIAQTRISMEHPERPGLQIRVRRVDNERTSNA